MKLPIRSMYIASAGCTLIEMDLSQAESWVVAFSAREESMKHALKGGFIHEQTASLLFNKPIDQISKPERYIGKKCNHALAYRMGAEQLFRDFNKEAQFSNVTITLAQAKSYRNKWHSSYHIKAWWDSIEGVLRNGRTITTIYGRRRIFYNRWGNELFKEATAFIPQSTVADHTLGAVQKEVGIEGGIIGINRFCKSHTGCNLLLTAHDSALLEVPRGCELEIAQQVHTLFARPMVINGVEFTIPADVKVGERWGEMEALKL